MTSLDPNERPYIITLSLATYFPTALLFYTTDGAARNFFSHHLLPQQNLNPRQWSCTRLGPLKDALPDWATAPLLSLATRWQSRKTNTPFQLYQLLVLSFDSMSGKSDPSWMSDYTIPAPQLSIQFYGSLISWVDFCLSAALLALLNNNCTGTKAQARPNWSFL